MALNHIVNGSRVEVKKHQLMGTVGYTKVGNPTIVDGVASGFSSNDYLSVSAPANTLNNNFDIIIKYNEIPTTAFFIVFL